MKVLKKIEDKININKMVCTVSIIISCIIAITSLYYAHRTIQDSTKLIYVMSDNTPIVALRTDFDVNRPVEYKANIDYFHSLFFNLTPDNKFIEGNMKKAMYLVDESGLQQYRNIKERGYFDQIISTNSVVKLVTDSIVLSDDKTFTFYGKQIIDRKTSRTFRNLITKGSIMDIPRSDNNAHGVLITNWRTINNSDISTIDKY